MRPVKIFTDSTSDLPKELIEQNAISIIPLYVNFGTESFRDNVDINPAQLFLKVKETGKLPMTSAPTVADFVTAFQEYIDQGMDIIHVSISSRISASYQNACTAASQFPDGRIRVIDSWSLSSGIGMSVMNAVDCLKKGLTLDETYHTVLSAVPRVRAEFAIDTLEYLHKGGRCSGLQMLLSSVLEIHPILALHEGYIRVAAKVRGNRQAVLRKMTRNVTDNIDRIDPKRIFVANCECPEDSTQMHSQFTELNRFEQILLTSASCVIASHCGPNTSGIFYMEN
jgi:DegV family protein with EDD domain